MSEQEFIDALYAVLEKIKHVTDDLADITEALLDRVKKC